MDYREMKKEHVGAAPRCPALSREDFRALLFRYLNRSGRTNPEIYRAAQIDRKLFSAICTKPHYQPSRGTVIRLALAL